MQQNYDLTTWETLPLTAGQTQPWGHLDMGPVH